LLAGSASEPTLPVSEAYFEGLRDRVRAAAMPLSEAVLRR